MKEKLTFFVLLIAMAVMPIFAEPKTVVYRDVKVYISSLNKTSTYFMTNSEEELKNELAYWGFRCPALADYNSNPALAKEVCDEMSELDEPMAKPNIDKGTDFKILLLL